MSTSIEPLPEELIGDMEREGWNWAGALAEVIDNAFDANATKVEISVTKEQIDISDDGDGCEFPQRMLQKGFSTKRGKRGVTGRYGVGLKHSSFFICGIKGDTSIKTTHGGKTRLVVANWGNLISNKSWEIEDPLEIDAAPHDRGTSITFVRGPKRFPTGENLNPVLDELAFMFSPALSNGRAIIVSIDGKRLALSPPAVPKWIDSIDCQVQVGKKTAHIHAGIVAPDTPNRRRGLSYFFAHRNIITSTSKGCNGYPVAHVSGSVELDGSWKLGQNKASITDDDWDALCDAVLEKMQPLLIKAAQQTEHLASTRLKTSLEQRINETFGKAMRPGKSGKARSVKPVGTARFVKRASKVSGVGSVLSANGTRAGAISIEFITDPDDAMCRVDLIGSRVTLNRHFAFVKANESSENRDALLALIMGSFIHATLTSNGWQKSLSGMENTPESDRFAVAMSEMLTEFTTAKLADAA